MGQEAINKAMQTYLLDTNILIALTSKKNFYKIQNFLEKLNKPNTTVAICGIVLTEFLRGLNEVQHKKYLNQISKLPYFDTTHEIFIKAGISMAELRRKGKIISLGDGVIAEVAKAHKATLITLDKDFEHFPVLKKKILNLENL